jgi:hypothetical protein
MVLVVMKMMTGREKREQEDGGVDEQIQKSVERK